MGPKVIVVADNLAMSTMAADIVAETLSAHPAAAISLPTGSTPVGLFNELIERSKRGALELTRFHLFCLDEYLGVLADDPNTLTSWLIRTFIGPAGIPLDHVHTLPVADDYPEAAARRYEDTITECGGLELAVLGIGGNGHIAYNEPGSPAHSRTRIVHLTPGSMEQAAGYFGGAALPTKAMTVGIGTLLEARKIVLIVSGAAKQDILHAALKGPLTAEVPASWLRLAADRVTVIADEAAAAKLG